MPHLPDAIRPVARFAYITGWRIPSEVLTLQWRQVDFGSGQVRLDPGTTKNGEGRVFPMTAALRELLEDQRAERDRLRAERGSHRPRAGERPASYPWRPIRTGATRLLEGGKHAIPNGPCASTEKTPPEPFRGSDLPFFAAWGGENSRAEGQNVREDSWAVSLAEDRTAIGLNARSVGRVDQAEDPIPCRPGFGERQRMG